MIVFVLFCTLIGYLCGSALIGLACGVLLTVAVSFMNTSPLPRARARRRIRNRRKR